MISGNMVGSYSQMGKTFTLVDESGNEIVGVVVDQETVFTAHDNDVREGMVYASDEGVSTGSKVIPAYHTTEGYKLISAGEVFKLDNFEYYNYTKLQVMICAFNSSISNSVATEKVSIDGKVYNTGSVDVIAQVTTHDDNKSINLNITNSGTLPCVMRYFTYKEIK